MRKSIASLATLVAAAAVAGLGVATVTVGTTPALASAASSSINYYETPCQVAARETYGVPLRNDALVQWQLDHAGTPGGTAYNRAALACPQPAKWSFEGMILVGRE